MIRKTILCGLFAVALVGLTFTTTARAELLGYWSGNSTGGAGTSIPNDQGNAALNGSLVGGATYSTAGQGHSGLAGDYAMNFLGTDADYGVLPPTGVTLSSATVTAWVKGHQTGDWAGLVFSRDDAQPIGIDYNAGSGQLAYTWNDNSADTWGFVSGLSIPKDEWTFVAMTVTPSDARLYVGPKGGALTTATSAIAHSPQLNDTEWRLAEDNCCGTARNFSGSIDDVAIWSNALSADQIAALHSGAATPLSIPEPSTSLLLLLGCGFVVRYRRRIARS